MVRVDFLGFVLLLSDISRFNRYSPMETLLSEQTTGVDKIVLPSPTLLLPQLAGGGYLPAVRSLSGESGRSGRASAGH